MTGKTFISLLICVGAFVLSPSSAMGESEENIVKRGLSLCRIDLQHLVQQILTLPAGDVDQGEFLHRLFQMKFEEAERLIEVNDDSEDIKQIISELFLLKALENNALGNWIQSFYALKDAEGWSKEASTKSLRIANKQYNISALSKNLENEMRSKGNEVQFHILPFPKDRMFRPDNLTLGQSYQGAEAEKKGLASPSPRKNKASESPVASRRMSNQDKIYMLERFHKALHAYYYDPIEDNATFMLYLPHGDYYLFEKDFFIRPVEFILAGPNTQVIVEPAKWFKLDLSKEVKVENITLSFHGMEWKDFDHVPFGCYQVQVKNEALAGPADKICFVPAGGSAAQEKRDSERSKKVIEIEEKGVYQLIFHERNRSERQRYKLHGY